MIEIRNLLKRFDSTIAVDIEELVINQNDIFGLLGNNGAGKTTLIRLILDLLKPHRGLILSKAERVYQSEHWKKYTGSYIDNNFLIEFLTPEEYFEFIGFIHGIESSALKKRLESFGSFLDGEIIGKERYIRSLSSGNKQKVGIVGAMISEPEILILDEPFNFLDPSSQINLKNILNRCFAGKTKTIILSSHNLFHITDLCTRMALMEKGKIIKDCSANSLTINEIEAYFEAQIEI